MAKFVFIEVEYMGDPRDMFFGIVKDIGYVDASEAPKDSMELVNKA
jgi:hypothetical protein